MAVTPMTLRPFAALALAALFAAPALAGDPGVVSPDRLAEHVKVLAAPEFAGRAPGGPGEPLTIDYLIRQFQALGLQPAGDNGGWTSAAGWGCPISTCPTHRVRPSTRR